MKNYFTRLVLLATTPLICSCNKHHNTPAPVYKQLTFTETDYLSERRADLCGAAAD
ncbi:hypothetical protein [Arachidicoccus ginsenosidivorans]